MTTTALRAAPEQGPPPPPHRRRLWVPLLLVLAGVAVLLYPVLATQLNNRAQREFAEQYAADVAETDGAVLSRELRRARAYNRTIHGIPILDPWLTRVSAYDPKSGPYRDYLEQLSRFEAMARVRVPSAEVDLPVEHGTTDEVIARGAGHLYGTSLPVGGRSTHAVLTSHTGMATATLFDHLDEVEVGDTMYVDVAGATLAYEVDRIKVVEPDEIGDLTTVQGEDLLTLFTCTPYSVNTHRLLVRGHRVPYSAEADPGPTAGWSLEPWMWWLIAAAALALLLMVALVVRERRRRRRRRGARHAASGR